MSTPRRITNPTLQPITLAEAKEHLRVVHTDEDDYITGLIGVAVDYVEGYLHRSILTQTWRLEYQQWPDMIQLRPPPVASIDAVTYIDTDGASQTLASSVYVIDNTALIPELKLAYNQSWPDVRNQVGAIQVDYIAGDTAAANVPNGIKSIVKIALADLYENRESREPVNLLTNRTFENLAAQYRINAV